MARQTWLWIIACLYVAGVGITVVDAHKKKEECIAKQKEFQIQEQETFKNQCPGQQIPAPIECSLSKPATPELITILNVLVQTNVTENMPRKFGPQLTVEDRNGIFKCLSDAALSLKHNTDNAEKRHDQDDEDEDEDYFALINILAAATGAILAAPFALVGGVVAGAGSVVGGVAAGAGAVVGGVAGGAGSVLGGVAGGAGNVLGGVAGGPGNVPGGVAGGAGNLMGGVAGGAGNVLGGVAGGAANLVGGVAGGAGNVLGGVAGGPGNVLRGVAGVPGNVPGGVVGGPGNVPGGVVVPGGVAGGAGNLVGGVAGGAGNVLGGVAGGAANLVGGVASGAGALAGGAGALANGAAGLPGAGKQVQQVGAGAPFDLQTFLHKEISLDMDNDLSNKYIGLISSLTSQETPRIGPARSTILQVARCTGPADLYDGDHDPSVESLFFPAAQLQHGTKLTLEFSKSINTAPFYDISQIKGGLTGAVSGGMLIDLLVAALNPPGSCDLSPDTNAIDICDSHGASNKACPHECSADLASMFGFITTQLGKEVHPCSAPTTIAATKLEYKIAGFTKLPAEMSVGCAKMVCPVATFMCQNLPKAISYMVSLEASDGTKVETPCVCHEDTKSWNAQSWIFSALKSKPGECGVCHFLAADDISWIPKTAAAARKMGPV